MAHQDRGSDAWVNPPRVAIVSTSVNPSPRAYAAWASQGDLIVAGDVNSPPELADFIEALGGEYLTPKDQNDWPFSDIIGWRSIQRRNAAAMVAYARHYDYVVTVDDDNYPSHNWVMGHVQNIRGKVPDGTVVAFGDGEWVDPGRFVTPNHKMRGTPFGAVHTHTLAAATTGDAHTIVVSTAQVLGDPDCTAVTRLTQSPKVTEVNYDVIVGVNQWVAFNSQATVWEGRWSPLLAVLPFVGRYDDIIASFIAKRIMMAHDKTVFVGEPAVVQTRNEHDVVGDLRNEYYGMEATPGIVKCLEFADVTWNMTLPDAYGACIDALTWHNALHPDALRFMQAWRTVWIENEWQEEAK